MVMWVRMIRGVCGRVDVWSNGLEIQGCCVCVSGCVALIIKFAARRRGVARQCLHTGGDIFVTGTDQCGTGIEELLTHGLHAVRDAAGHWGRIAEDCLQRTAHVIVDMCTDLKILSRSWNRTESSLNAARSLVDVISIHLEFAM